MRIQKEIIRLNTIQYNITIIKLSDSNIQTILHTIKDKQMIIEIEANTFQAVLKIVKLRSKTIYDKIKDIQPLEAIQDNSLQKARDIKTIRVKERIKVSIDKLKANNIKPNKYQIHKDTNISYITLSKYYEDIVCDTI